MNIFKSRRSAELFIVVIMMVIFPIGYWLYDRSRARSSPPFQQAETANPDEISQRFRDHGYDAKFLTQDQNREGRAVFLFSAAEDHFSSEETSQKLKSKQFPQHLLIVITGTSEVEPLAISCENVVMYKFGSVRMFTVDPEACSVLNRFVH